jgi:nitronate monooxygenase
MDFLRTIKLIQGGMGVYVSNWRLARAVAMERPGITAGTVSGTALEAVHTRLLQLGDPGGHLRRALNAFDIRFGVQIGRKIIDRFFIAGGKAPDARFRGAPMLVARAVDGRTSFLPQPGTPTALTLDLEAIELVIASAFSEVWLAKEGHTGRIFINFLNKVELPLIFAIYGAMLAGVDGIIVGAGNPDGLPALCSQMAVHQTVRHDLPVLYRESGEQFQLEFNPHWVAEGMLTGQALQRPAFLAIVSLQNLVQVLAQSPTQPPDGFIIEHHTAGGHNAAPQGPLVKDALGQPVYGAADEPDLEAIRAVGLPFWMAGGYGSHEGFLRAQSLGAIGIQAGSSFAVAEESGMKPEYKHAILAKIKHSTDDEALVRTTLYSPTGYPFKVVQMEGTLSDDVVYNARKRVCDLGYLQQRALSQPGEDGTRKLLQRCAAAGLDEFINKRGLPRNAEDKRCLCNGLLATAGLAQVGKRDGELYEEPAIVTLGNHVDGIRRLSRNGQTTYWARDVVEDILGPA